MHLTFRHHLTDCKTRRAIGGLLCLVAMFAATWTAPLRSQTPEIWEFSPYHIQVWLATAPTAEIDQQVTDRLLRGLAERADAVVGAPWDLKTAMAPVTLQDDLVTALPLLQPLDIHVVDKTPFELDKLMLVTIASDTEGWTIKARELDCHAWLFGPVIERRIRQPELVVEAAFDAVVQAFAPIVRVEEGEAKTARTRAKALGLVLDESSPAYIGKGDVLQPVLRNNDRNGQPAKGKVDAVEFTFLQVTDNDPINPSVLNCNVHSTFRSPVQGRSTSRKERYGVVVRPTLPSTRLSVWCKQLRPDNPPYALAGLELHSRVPLPEAPRELTDAERQESEKRNSPKLLGVTNWQGSVDIPRGDDLLQVVYLKSGGQLLARVPIVAGLHSVARSEVPDDALRLQAEGYVKGIQGEITDLVVQRALTALLMRRRMTEGKIEDAEKLMEKFRSLRTRNDLLTTIDSQKRPIDVRLDRPSNAASRDVQRRIETLFADARSMINKYIDPDLSNALLNELSKAKANPVPAETLKAPPPAGAAAPPLPGSARPVNAPTTTPPAGTSTSPSNSEPPSQSGSLPLGPQAGQETGPG